MYLSLEYDTVDKLTGSYQEIRNTAKSFVKATLQPIWQNNY